MKLKLVLLLIPLLFVSNAIAQHLLWSKGFYGNVDESPKRTIIDVNNNLYIIGTFSDSINIGGVGQKTKGGASDIFLVKYDKNGIFQWLRRIGSAGQDYANGLGVNSANEIYVAGYFGGTRCYIDSTSTQVVYLDNYVGAGGSTDIFIAKYDADGNLLWKRRSVYGTGNQTSQAMRLDKQGNIILTGTFSTSTLYFGATDTLVNNRANPIIFIAKFNSSGDRIWKKRIDCAATSILYNLDSYNNGYYFAGYYQTRLYPTDGIGQVTTRGANNDMILYKTDTAGTCKWVRVMRGGGTDQLWSVGSDVNGNAFIAGHFNTTASQVKLAIDSFGTPTVDTSKITYSTLGSNDIFIAKYDEFGTLQWSEHDGSTGNDQMRRILATSNNFIFVGSMGGNVTIEGTPPLTWKGGTGADALAIVRDNQRNLIYAIQAGGTNDDIGETGAIDNEGNFYFIGDFKSAACQVGGSSLPNTSTGTSDVFIAKFDKMSLNLVPTNPKCNGSSDGQINCVVKGLGETPFRYSWNTGNPADTFQTVTGLVANKYYTVTVTDNKNHIVKDSMQLTQPTAIILSKTFHSNVSCNGGNDGALTVSASGGTPGYTYNCSTTDGGGMIINSNIQTTLIAGIYTFTVQDAVGCIVSRKDTITQPAKVNIGLHTYNVSAKGAGDGAVKAIPTGGTSPYTYHWNTGSSNDSIFNLSGGNYQVTVTDNKLCKDSAVTTVLEPGMLSALINSSTNVTCFGLLNGSATATAVGDFRPFSFSWSKVGGGFSSTDSAITGLAYGTYIITVVNSNTPVADTARNTVIITQPPLLTKSHSITDVQCAGSSTGAASILVSGGTHPYSYNWSKQGGGFSATTPTISEIPAGTYICAVHDSLNCTLPNDTVTVTDLYLPLSRSRSDSVERQKCYGGTNDGRIILYITGGNGTKTYTWNEGSSGNPFSNLAPGNYSCTVKDQSNCVFTTGTITVNAGPQISGFINTHNITCNGANNGSAKYNQSPINQGNGGLTYQWNDPLNTVGDSVGNLTPNNYTITVTDALNCKAYFTTPTPITQPSALNLIEDIGSHIDVKCHGESSGQLGVTATGGYGNYEYQLNGGSWGTSNILSGLIADNYNIVLRDKDYPSCQYSGMGPIVITEPADFIVNLSADPGNSVCPGTNVTFTATPSGFSGYDFQIGGISVQNNSSNTFVTSALTTGNIITVTVDSSGCTKTPTGILMTIFPNPTATASIVQQTSSRCLDDGIAKVVASGGTGPYTYSWNTVPAQLNDTAISLAVGDYIASVTDANGCGPVTSSVTVTEPQAITVSTPVVQDASSETASDGSITVTGSGGNGQLTYILTPGNTENTTGVFIVPSGYYIIGVRDAFNCDTAWTSNIFVGFNTGIGSNLSLINFKITPNPTDGKLNIEFNDPQSGTMIVEVYNIKGEKILLRTFPVNSTGKYKEVIDLSTSPKGMYFIRINNHRFKDAIILK